MFFEIVDWTAVNVDESRYPRLKYRLAYIRFSAP